MAASTALMQIGRISYGIGSPAHTRKCPTCNGSGINPVLPSRICPKCKGERVVAIRWYGQ